jgi:UDP-N-acetylglucosamine 4,6-dehydratase
VILPSKTAFELNEFVEKFQAIKVPLGFVYNSGNNEDWETIESLQEKIAEHVKT